MFNFPAIFKANAKSTPISSIAPSLPDFPPWPAFISVFNKNDVEVEFEDNLLTVRTKQVDKSENKNDDGEIIHKGISQRHFARSFTIADDVKVNGAQLKDGL